MLLSSCDIGNPIYDKSPEPIDYDYHHIDSFVYEVDGDTKAPVQIELKSYYQDGEVWVESFEYRFLWLWQEAKCNPSHIRQDIKDIISEQFNGKVNF